MAFLSSTYAALFLSGLLGSLGHCLGMCGPLVLMVGSRLKTNNQALIPVWLMYHGSRIVVYALLGAIVGGIGTLLSIGSHISRVAGIFSILLGTGIILLGLSYLGLLSIRGFEGNRSWWSAALTRAMSMQGKRSILMLGA